MNSAVILDQSVTGSRIINAGAQELFDVVASPSMHHVIDGSGTVKNTLKGADKLGLGDTFTTRMRVVVPYVIRNTVKEFDDGHLIAWSHIAGWRWRFEFEEVEGGTLVTETFDWSFAHPLAVKYVQMAGWPERNVSSIDQTLARLNDYAERKDLGGSDSTDT